MRLGQGEVQKQTAEHLAKLWCLLHSDPALPLTDTVVALLATEVHILIRFATYKRFLAKLWEMCAKYNESGFVSACKAFLHLSVPELDAGYSAFLQEEALPFGSESSALQV